MPSATKTAAVLLAHTMNKLTALFIIGAAAVLMPFRVWALDMLEVPSYVDTKASVPVNVRSIVKALTSNAGGLQEAQDDADYYNTVKRKLAASLYAEALTTRTNLIADEKKAAAEKTAKAAGNALAGISGSKDKKEIIANDIQPQLVSIAKRLNSIMTLEAMTANLEGTMMITGLPKSNTDVISGDEAQEEEAE